MLTWTHFFIHIPCDKYLCYTLLFRKKEKNTAWPPALLALCNINWTVHQSKKVYIFRMKCSSCKLKFAALPPFCAVWHFIHSDIYINSCVSIKPLHDYIYTVIVATVKYIAYQPLTSVKNNPSTHNRKKTLVHQQENIPVDWLLCSSHVYRLMAHYIPIQLLVATFFGYFLDCMWKVITRRHKIV